MYYFGTKQKPQLNGCINGIAPIEGREDKGTIKNMFREKLSNHELLSPYKRRERALAINWYKTLTASAQLDEIGGYAEDPLPASVLSVACRGLRGVDGDGDDDGNKMQSDWQKLFIYVTEFQPSWHAKKWITSKRWWFRSVPITSYTMIMTRQQKHL